jgi:hypothetical protein
MQSVNFLEIIKKKILGVVFLSLVFSLAAVWGESVKNKNYTGYFLIGVYQEGKAETADYEYDNFYYEEAVSRFSDSLEKWLKTPDFGTRVFEEKAGSLGTMRLSQRTNFFKIKRVAPQYLEVKFESKNKEEALKLREKVVTEIEREVSSKKEGKAVWFKIDPHELIFTKEKLSPLLVAGTSFVVGIFIFSLFLIAKDFLTYSESNFKRKKDLQKTHAYCD